MFTMYCIHIIHNLVHLVGYLYVKDVISARKMIHIKMDLNLWFANCFRKQNSLQMSRKQQAVALQLALAQHPSVKEYQQWQNSSQRTGTAFSFSIIHGLLRQHYTRGAQMPGVRSPKRLKFVLILAPIFWDPQHGNRYTLPSWQLDFWGGSYICWKNCASLRHALKWVA